MKLNLLGFFSARLHAWQALVVALSFLVTACSCNFSSEKLEIERAEQSVKAKNFKDGYIHYRRIIDKNPKTELALKATAEAARLAHYELKDFNGAIELYRNLVLYSPNEQERIFAQSKIAEIYFESLNDYQNAIVEYNKLLDLPHSLQQEFEYRLAIAKSYFYLNNFFQARTELDQLQNKFADKDQVFEILFVRANILLASKDLDGAIKILRDVEQRDPENFKKENLGLILAKCYEEKKDLLTAIEVLKSMRPYYSRVQFLDQRIANLKEQAALLPGAKGLKH